MATQSTATLNKFCNTMLEFLESVNEVFPECVDTASALMQMRVLMSTNMMETKDKLVREWHNKMGPHYEACGKRNDNMILNAEIPMLSKFHIAEKWQDPEFDQDSKDAMWEYINMMNKLAAVHCAGTPSSMGMLHEATAKFMQSMGVQQAADGTVSFNAHTVTEFVQKSMSEGEVARMVNELLPGVDGNALQGLLAQTMSSADGGPLQGLLTGFQNAMARGPALAEGTRVIESTQPPPQ
jgi:hypothetical protein